MSDDNNISRKAALKWLGGIALGPGLLPSLFAGEKEIRKADQNNKQVSRQSQPDKPHIIFLMTDQQRADCLGCAGNDSIITPNMDAIAKEGAHFTNGYSAAPSCTPARACLLTGLNPWNNGLLGYGRIARKYKYEMPEMISNGGYYTYCIGKNHWWPQKSLKGFNGTLIDSSGRIEQDGYVSDYHDWFKRVAPGENPDKTGLGWNSYHAKAYALKENLHPTHWIGESAINFIKNYNLEKPLYLKVSWERPHSPYDPPQRVLDMYKNIEIPSPSIGGKGSWDEKYADYHPKNPNAWLGNFGNKQAIKSRRHYYANITFVDEQIGKIIQTLKDKGMYENSFIFFCSDHGDMLGDHYHWRKTYAYQGSSAIPFIIKWPQTYHSKVKRGTKLNQPVGLQDVLPTFLDISGQKVPDDMDGKSMLNLIRGDSNGWRKYIGMEHSTCYFHDNYWASVTDGKFKYIWFFHAGELFFDLENDPGEKHNLIPSASNNSKIADRLNLYKNYLIDYLKERGPGFVKDGHLVKRTKTMLYGPNYPESKENNAKWLKYWKKEYKNSYTGDT